MARATIVLLLLVVACVCISDACPPNQRYDSCGPACEGRCGEEITDCIEVCTPGCHCLKGYVKNSKDQCVLPKDCNKH